jgi:hypothetical protein
MHHRGHEEHEGLNNYPFVSFALFVVRNLANILIYSEQLAIAMLHSLAGEIHACLCGENETVAENFRAW